MKDLKVIFMGTPDFSVPILEYLNQNTNVVLVVTQPDKETGRDKEVKFSPVKELALKNGIDVYQPVKIRKEHEIISELNPDLIVTCAYGQIIPKDMIDIPRLGCINVHASLLPKYRGASPIQAALLNGDEETGVTIMYMDENMDTGDIISCKKCKIDPEDNVGTLHDKLSSLGVELLSETLPLIYKGSNERIKQNDEKATYTKMIKREDELLNFNDTGRNIINKIRALNPWPGVYFNLQNGPMKVIKASFIEEKNSEVNKIKYLKKQMQIGCQDGYIDLEIVKPNGKKQMDITSYLNGSKKEDEYVS